MDSKQTLRKSLRSQRRDHVQAIPETMKGLVFHRPPAPLLDLIPGDATIGLYRAGPFEAPTAAYAQFFFEEGHRLALPRFSHRNSEMEFVAFADPFEESDCEVGPFGILQPTNEAEQLSPDVLFVPLLGFTETGDRIGQGGGHYDRWLSNHPERPAFGLAWDVQKVEDLPLEEHDMNLTAVVTPTRLFGPF